MSVIIVQNDPEVPAGVFSAELAARGISFRTLRADLGAPLNGTPAAVVVLGGIMGVHDEAQHPFLRPLKAGMKTLLANGTPLLGICLGGQLLAAVAGGTVTANHCGEKGLVDITLTGAGRSDPLFAGVDACFPAFQWHHDSFAVPPAACHLAASAACPGQAFRIGRAWGVQFHPEVDAGIVAAWVGRSAQDTALVDEFAAAEAVHRRMARRLLGNFLALAGVTG